MVEVKFCESISASTNDFKHASSSMNFIAYSQSPWIDSSDSYYPLNETFLSDESIVETMSLEETPWNDIHHRSSFLLSLVVAQLCLKHLAPHVPRDSLPKLMSSHEIFSEGNMGSITETMPIDIFVKPRIVENIHIGLTCSLEEVKLYTILFQ